MCLSGRYKVPTMEDIPDELRCKSSSEQALLSVFEIDVGKYERRKNGYHVKRGGITLRTKAEGVVDRINGVGCSVWRRQLKSAYTYLIRSETSMYR